MVLHPLSLTLVTRKRCDDSCCVAKNACTPYGPSSSVLPVLLCMAADAAPQLGEVTWPGLEGSKPLLVVVANSTVQLPAACELQPYVNGWPASKLQQSNCTQQLLYSRSGPSDNSVGRGNPWIRQALMYNSTLSKNSKLLVCPDVPGRPCEHDFPWTHTDWLAAVLLARFAGT